MNARDPGFMSFECSAADGCKLRGSLHRTASPDAPCVIFCHGFTGHRIGPGYLFVKLSRALADAGIASVRFDFRGAGESEGLFSDMNTISMMEDIDRIAAETRTLLAPRRLILCGHSFGGMIAARRAAASGAHGLILLSPVGDPQGMVRRRKELLEAGPNKAGFFENGPHEMSLSFLDGLLGIDPADELSASFTGNLLLLQGDRDLSISIDESYRYIAMAATTGITADYHLLKGSDHNYTRVTDVATVATTIVSWTKEHFSA